MTAINRRKAYEVVDQFEEALCEYTGAPYCVATDSCTNAIFMALLHSKVENPHWAWTKLMIPKHNYVGVVQAAVNARWDYEFTDEEWEGSYQLRPTHVIDSAKEFDRNMYQGGYVSLSFGSSKLLPIGRGGAILLDNQEAADWIRPRTMDGRTPGEDYMNPSFVTPAWRCNMTPEQAARGLDLLTYIDDEADDTWESYPDLSKATWA